MGNFEEKLESLRRKENLIKKQQKALITKHAENERKLRTRSLVEIGGIAIAVLKESEIEVEPKDFNKEGFAMMLRSLENKGHYYSRSLGYEKEHYNEESRENNS